MCGPPPEPIPDQQEATTPDIIKMVIEMKIIFMICNLNGTMKDLASMDSDHARDLIRSAIKDSIEDGAPEIIKDWIDKTLEALEYVWQKRDTSRMAYKHN